MRAMNATALSSIASSNTKQERLGEPAMDDYGFGRFGDVAIWRDTDGSVYCIYNTNDEKKFGQGLGLPVVRGAIRWFALHQSQDR